MNENYEPFGEAWSKEMNKFTKLQLIESLKSAYMKIAILEDAAEDAAMEAKVADSLRD